ncbi:MAG TPA: putative Na+/H+ antiporter, partial [Verrucomicrobiae bacterium]|nr:putative Na+/H+ antiporter [Verrucomicrobiae bacterium]
MKTFSLLCLCCLGVVFGATGSPVEIASGFPPHLESYGDSGVTGLWSVLENRVRQQPLNLVVTLLFVGAIMHTFMAQRFLRWAHALERRQAHGFARTLHFLGEVEVIFGLWCVPLLVILAARIGWDSSVDYFSNKIRFVEPVFVVVIMSLASTRPVLQLAERFISSLARVSGGGSGAWWLSILTVGPVLGSLITEPAAMTISALLLAKRFYVRKPSPRLAYGTLGLLFVNISIGGVLTHFAAPPVLMVAAPWGWTTPIMFMRFGWVALLAILIANTLYYFTLRPDFRRLGHLFVATEAEKDEARVPAWITAVHLGFMLWSVITAHYPVLLVGGFLFFLAFAEITREHQSKIQLRAPLLVGCFLAGLVVHGGLQQWWIEPILARLGETPLLLAATGLTAFNDNAAITYLATLVPGLSDGLKYAVVAGAVAGGGLTVIANAPNPAGQAILGRFFPAGISPGGLLLG